MIETNNWIDIQYNIVVKRRIRSDTLYDETIDISTLSRQRTTKHVQLGCDRFDDFDDFNCSGCIILSEELTNNGWVQSIRLVVVDCLLNIPLNTRRYYLHWAQYAHNYGPPLYPLVLFLVSIEPLSTSHRSTTIGLSSGLANHDVTNASTSQAHLSSSQSNTPYTIPMSTFSQIPSTLSWPLHASSLSCIFASERKE